MTRHAGAPAPTLGPKAARLRQLAAQGWDVPRFIVVDSEMCARLTAPVHAAIDTHLAALRPADPGSARQCADAIAELILALEFPAEIAHAVAAQLSALQTTSARFAVRSSMAGEDSAADSFAGQFDTMLNVPATELHSAVLRCVASAYSERSLLYRSRRGVTTAPVRAAVMIQEMVDAVVSGVAFSCHPTTGSTIHAVVVAAPGLGEGVVGATVDCDTYVVDRATGTIVERTVPVKHSSVLPHPRGGTAVTAVAPTSEPALSDARILELARLVGSFADEHGQPQDLEWAVDTDGRIRLLQLRPVTAVTGREVVFDNINVAESYPGLVSPLTFTFVADAYARVFGECHRHFGATRRTVAQNSTDVYPYLLAYLRGRMYYNISNWYRLFVQIPGMGFAVPGWEAALGMPSATTPAPTAGRLATLRERCWTARALVILLAGWRRLPARFREFDRTLEQAVHSLEALLSADPRRRYADSADLVAWLERFTGTLAPSYSAQIMNDFIAQQLFRLIEVLLRRAGVADPHPLRNALFCGETGVHSVEPVHSALRLANRVERDPRLRELFTDGSHDTAVWATLVTDDSFRSFHQACVAHIRRYGDRTINELKLETDSMAEDPTQIVAIVRNLLGSGRSVATMTEHERTIRAAAERDVRSALSGKPLQRMLIGQVLRHARAAVKAREHMRLGRSRCFGLAKRLYRQIGVEYCHAGLLDTPRDIFYLTHSDVVAMARGTFVDGAARHLVAARKADHQRWHSERPPSRITLRGLPAAHQHRDHLETADGADTLSGTGCAPGRVRARALVLDDPATGAPVAGEILVASTTDPGWVFLMVAAAGLVSERGSILSHTAIIGRELGIPTVVGVPGVTRWIHSGELITLDGDTGTVTAHRSPTP